MPNRHCLFLLVKPMLEEFFLPLSGRVDGVLQKDDIADLESRELISSVVVEGKLLRAFLEL